MNRWISCNRDLLVHCIFAGIFVYKNNKIMVFIKTSNRKVLQIVSKHMFLRVSKQNFSQAGWPSI